MEVNDQTLGVLKDLLVGAMSPSVETRKAAEAVITSSESQAGFPLLVLTLISRLAGTANINTPEATMCHMAAILFKNMVKKRWERPEDDAEQLTEITTQDKEAIKAHIVELMCIAPVKIQSQLSEAVTSMSKHDFPHNWPGLLPQLVAKLGTQDVHIVKSVMLTANSIFKRFRNVEASDAVFSEVLLCLQGFAAPLLAQFQATSNLVHVYANQKPELAAVFETLRLMSRIFFSLNWQDIPEFFEDNIALWMTEFSKYLSYTNPLLVDASEESSPGPVERLQAAILENLNLYAAKYEDVFESFLPQFTQLVWKLLMEVGVQEKYDILATSAIKFLTSVSGKQRNMALFTEATQKDIIEHIVVKNLTATEADEELFEDNSADYIRKDMEGSDQDTRRRSATELVRSLLKLFGPQISQLCVSYIQAMLEHYTKSQDWRAKDAALHLVLAVAVKSSSGLAGAGELNPHVNILSIFDSHVLPEVQDQNVNVRPIVKADAIKMICVFRSHLQTPFLLSILPHIIRHLHSKHVVIQTYAAMCIERFLTVKDRDRATNTVTMRITKESLAPHYQTLFSGLFAVLENKDLPENDYVMKCIMRTLVVIGADIGPVTELVLSHLTTALERVCKNPINPHYNHYLFESVAVLVRSCTSPAANPALTPEAALSAAARFEALLFPPFQSVLQLDVAEFIPYVFQILGQLLCSRPANAGFSEAYRALFPPLLSPVLWERRGNVPALTDLFIAYISRGMSEIASANHITGVLGVWQKLLASKATEVYSFQLLNALFSCNPVATLQPFLPTIFNLLLQRMQASVKESKVVRFARLFIHSLCVFSAAYGPALLCDTLEAMTAGLVGMLVQNIWSVNAEKLSTGDDQEVKQTIVGSTRLLTESAHLQSKPEAWSSLLRSTAILVGKVVSVGTNTGPSADDLLNGDDENAGESLEFDSAYSKLAYATIPGVDVCAEVDNKAAPAFFAKQLVAKVGAIPQGLDARQVEMIQKLLQ